MARSQLLLVAVLEWPFPMAGGKLDKAILDALGNPELGMT